MAVRSEMFEALTCVWSREPIESVLPFPLSQDQFHDGLCRGEFEGEFRFSCDAGFARFVPLSQLRLDSRFLDGPAEGEPLDLLLLLLRSDFHC